MSAQSPAAPTPISDTSAAPEIQFSGNALNRWQLGDAEASLLQGDAVIQQGDRQLRGESILVVVDGPLGKVRSRVVIERGSNSPQAFTLLSSDDPSFQAPQFRGPPKQSPRLLKHLPREQADTIVQTVQFSETVPAPIPDSATNTLPSLNTLPSPNGPGNSSTAPPITLS
ncbi:hypothetical protein N9D23_13250, partial [Rubripirellula sp.]|nr:hypothetical protein [Rubripirellula sp.]